MARKQMKILERCMERTFVLPRPKRRKDLTEVVLLSEALIASNFPTMMTNKLLECILTVECQVLAEAKKKKHPMKLLVNNVCPSFRTSVTFGILLLHFLSNQK